MNEITLKGRLTNVRPSHKVGDIEYYAANLICKRETMDKDDTVDVVFKKLCFPYDETELDSITLTGNIRSFSEKVNGKNNVSIYVFTYFDHPTEMYEGESNHFEIDGRICKKEDIYVSPKGKRSIHFIVANNIVAKTGSAKLNSYLPSVAWGDMATKVNAYNVGDIVHITGELHSREYSKEIDGEMQICVAHELYITDITSKVEDTNAV